MGDAQSAQRETNKDAEAEEESGKVDDAPAETNADKKPLRISKINGKADSITAAINGHCEEITAEANPSPDKDVSGTAKQIKDRETPLDSVDINEKESPKEVNADEEPPLELIEIDAKQNDINDSFRSFFSNISLKLSVKRGSVEKDHIAIDVSDKTNKNESNRPEDIKETAKEAECDNTEQSVDPNVQGTYDNDSTTCPTLTDVTSEDIPENIQEKTAETKEESESDNVDTAKTSPEEEMVQQDVVCEDLNPAPTSSPETEEVVSPVKRFFTTGIFSGLWKKTKSIDDETVVRELVEMGKGTVQTKEKIKDIQQDNEINPVDTESTTGETENKEKVHVEENICAVSAPMMDGGEAPTTNSATATVTDNKPENRGSQDIVQDNPLKRLLSGSSFRKASKKQRGRKSSHEKLSDSGEHADQPKIPTKPAETPKEESPTQHSGEEDGAWASFKKLLTPKKNMKRSSLTNEEREIAGSVGETKPSEGETISENSTEEGKKRKDSSVSWEAVLCGSGKKNRTRKTSDSEEETPQTEDGNKKETMLLESSNQLDDITAISPKKAGSPSEGDGVSTWKSFKKLVTPKRKAKDEEEIKDDIQSDGEVTQDELSFSIKKFLPGRKKKKTADQVSSDEADKDYASGDEDSETPAVVPLSEFDTSETEVQIETQADIESHVPHEADYVLEKELHDQLAKPVIPSDSLQTEANKVQANKDNLKNEAPTAIASNEEPEDHTELFSKHHQLSDIPEEGIITDTIATQASIAEEAARDDTIMEDLIEITSEAITAPEPIDETEMISAVSQLSESSNTSGNITPVPVEYIKHTEALLQQVVETISISPKLEPVYSDERNSERIVGSVSNRILTELSEISESLSREIVSEAPTEEFVTATEFSVSYPEDSILKSVSTSESKPLVKRQCEINEAVSTETLPEVDSIVADKGCLIGVQQDEKEPQEIDTQEAELAALIAKCEDEGEKKEDQTPTQKDKQSLLHVTDQDQVENKDPHQVEVEKLQELQAVQDATSGSEECNEQLLEKVVSEESTAEETIADEPTEETVAPTEYNGEAKTEKLQADAAQPDPSEEPEVLETIQTATINLEEGNVQLIEKEVISDDSPSEETLIDESQEASEFIIQYTDAEKEDTVQADATQAEHFEGKVSEDVQTVTLNLEKDSGQVLEKKVILQNIQAQEIVTEKPKEETQPLNETDVKEEIENGLQTDAAQTAQVGKPELLKAMQTPTFNFEDCVRLASTEVISEDIPAEEIETVTDEPKEKIEPFTEYNVAAETENKHQKDTSQMEHSGEPEVLEDVQTAAVNLEVGSVQLLEKEVISEDSPAEEILVDESKEASEFVIQYTDAEKEDTVQVDATQAEHFEGKVSEDVQTVTLNLEKDSGQVLEKKVILQNIQAQEIVTEKPKEETQPLNETDVKEEIENGLQTDAAQTAQVGKPELLEAMQTPTFNFEDCVRLASTEVISEDIPAEEIETVTDEPKKKIEPLTEYNVAAETENKHQKDASQMEHSEEPEVLEDVQTAAINLEVGSVQLLEKEVISEDSPAEEILVDESKEALEFVTQYTDAEKEDTMQADATQTEQVLEAVQTDKLKLEKDSGQVLEKEVILQDIQAQEIVTEKPKEETQTLNEYDVKEGIENRLQTDAAQTAQVGKPELLEATQTAKFSFEDDRVYLLSKEDISAEETVIDKSKEKIEPLTEYNDAAETENKHPKDTSQMEHTEEQEVLEDVQTAAINLEVSSVQLIEKEVISEDSPTKETLIDSLKEASEFVIQYTDAEKEDTMQADAAQTEHLERKVLESVQTTTFDLKEESTQLLENEVTLEDTSAKETVTEKPEEETKPLIELDGAQIEHAEEQDVLETAPTAKPNIEENCCHLLETKDLLEHILANKTITDQTQPKEETGTFAEYEEETENKIKTCSVWAASKETEVSEVVQTATLNLEKVSDQMLEKELSLGDVSVQEKVTAKPKEETLHLTEYNVKEGIENRLQTNTAQTEQMLEAVQTATFSFEDDRVHLLSKEDISAEKIETVVDESKEKVEPLTEYNVAAEIENNHQKDTSQMEHTEEPEMLEDVQTVAINLEVSSVQLLEKEVISEDSPAEEILVDESKEASEFVTQYADAEKEDTMQADAAQTEQVLEAVQTDKLKLEKDSGQVLEKEVILQDIQAQEIVTEKPKEETQTLNEYDVKEGIENRLQTDAAQTAQVGKPELLEATQTAKFSFEDDRVHLVSNEDISAQEIETVMDKPKKIEPLTEYNVATETKNKHQKEASQMEHTEEQEVLEVLQTDTFFIEEVNLQTSTESKVPQAIPAAETFANILSENTLETETVMDETKEETEPLIEAREPVVAIESKHIQDFEVVEDATLGLEDGSIQSHDTELISEEIPLADTFTHELTQATEGNVEAEQSAEDVTGHIQVSPSNETEIKTVTEVESSVAAHIVSENVEEGSGYVLKVNEVQTRDSTPQNAQVSQEDRIPEVVDELQTVTAVHASSADEGSCVQVREKPVFSEVTPAALLENATFQRERPYAQHLSAVQSNVEERGIIPGFEAQHASVEHATIAQVITCHLKNVVAAIPDALTETKSESREPLIECVASQLDFKEMAATATPLVKNYVTMTEEDSSVVLMNVPLVRFKDSHQIQVQVVDVDIKSAEKTVDTALEVAITEGKEVIDGYHKSVKEVDKLSAKSETEETLIHEENMVIIQEVTQHVVSESVLVKLEQEVIKQTDVATDTSGMEEQNVEDTTVRSLSVVSSDGSATGEQVFKDDSFNNDKENSEDPKTEMEKSKVDVTTEEVKLFSDLKEMNEETQMHTEIAQNHTGIISLINNVESPSTLSLEFKVNIIFGQAKEPASPPPAKETTEPLKKTDVSKVGIQVVGPEKIPEEKQKTTESVDVAVQGTEITALEPAKVDQTEWPVITIQPLLLHVGMQSVETVEPAEQIKPTERGIAHMSHPGVAENCQQETKEEQPAQHSEEEADQDVWMDAEVDVDFLEETEISLHETDEPPEHWHESNQEEISAVEPDFEMAPTSMVEEEGNKQMFKQAETFETESEGEDFAVALDHSETVTASTAIMEWD